MDKRAGRICCGADQLISRAIIFALFLLVQTPAHAEGPVTPLFRDNDTLTVEINGPLKEIARRAPFSTDPHDGTLIARGETHQIRLSARGVSRRQRAACRFPPLKVKFLEKPDPSSLFYKQGSIKLVTHCRDNDRYEQIAMREYTTYKLYNLLTPESLKVRLVRIQYRDGQKIYAERYGFFIEDIDDAARRLDGKEIDVDRVSSKSLDAAAAARYSLFQYMIGNPDWAMIAGPAGSDCCHNSKLVGADKNARSNLTPIPYDFDNAGIVDAPYALPSERIPIKTVKQRYYRGFCRMNSEVKRIVPMFLSIRNKVEVEIGAVEGLKAASKKQMLGYLDGFYRQIAAADLIEKKILKTCR